MSMLKRARRFFRQKVRSGSTFSVIQTETFLNLMYLAALTCPMILPVSSMSFYPVPAAAAATSSSAAENPPVMRSPSSTPPLLTDNRLMRSSVDHRRVHPANLEDDYFGYWNPEPIEGIEGPGPIPH